MVQMCTQGHPQAISHVAPLSPAQRLMPADSYRLQWRHLPEFGTCSQGPLCVCVLNHRPHVLRCVDGRKQIATQALEMTRGARVPEEREVREAAGAGRQGRGAARSNPSSPCPRCCPGRADTPRG